MLHSVFNNILIYYVIRFLKSARTVFTLSASVLSICTFKLAKFDFAAKVDTSAILMLLN